MSESQWDKAARNAAEECFLSDWRYVGIIEPIITKHFADLRATYELLIELAIRHKKYIEVLNRCDHVRSADENVNSHLLEKLLADPLVQAAIERSKGNAKPR